MNKVLFSILISCFSLIISCGDDKEEFTDTDTTQHQLLQKSIQFELQLLTSHQISLFHQPKQELSPMGVLVHQGQPLRLVGTTQSLFLP